MSLIFSITTIPWVIKPLWGFISDTFPIFGYRRKSYLIILSLIHSFFWVLAAFYQTNLNLIVFFLFSIELCMAFCNVIGGIMFFYFLNNFIGNRGNIS